MRCRPHLRLIDELTHVTHDARSLLFGIARPVAQAPVHDGDYERQAGCIHGVDKDGVEERVQGGLGLGVGVCDG